MSDMEKKSTNVVDGLEGCEAQDQKNNGKEMQENAASEISETWAQDVIEDLDDFIEAQGIYLRQ